MESDATFLKTVKATILKHQMVQPGDRVVVAVSGGPDSVCLLDVLCRIRDVMTMALFVAHMNHGLRPDEDDQETEFVKRLAASHGLPCRVERVDHLRLGDPSLENRARDSRYRFLEECRQAFSAQKIALGHTLTDQAETLVMRLLRGSGPLGMGAIPPNRDNRFIRPLIGLSREQVLAYLERGGHDFMVDSSNKDPRFLRNQLRETLFPVLKSFQPNIVEILARTADVLREDEAWLGQEARDWVAGARLPGEKHEVHLPASAMAALPPALMNRVIRYGISLVKGRLWGISSRHVASVRKLVMGRKASAMVNLPGGVTARRLYGELILSRDGGQEPDPFCYWVEGPGTYRLDELGRVFRFQELQGPLNLITPPSSRTAFFDAEKVRYPLMIRNNRPGDRFVPHGMTGRKKLKDFFIDRKIPRERRAGVPLLVQGDSVLWVCGYRTDDRFRVHPETGRILRVDLMEEGEGMKEAEMKSED